MFKRVVVLAAIVALPAFATPQAFAQSYPQVGNVKAFSAGANFMSLPGYLRYLVHQQTGRWLTYAEAMRAVGQ
jgi:hypothetical protein